MNALSLIQATVEPAGMASKDAVHRQLILGLTDLGFRCGIGGSVIFKDHHAQQSFGLVVSGTEGHLRLEAYFGRSELLDASKPVTHAYVAKIIARTKTLVTRLLHAVHECPSTRDFHQKLEHALIEFGDNHPDLDRGDGDYFYQMERPRAVTATVEPGGVEVASIVRVVHSMLPDFQVVNGDDYTRAHKDGFEVRVDHWSQPVCSFYYQVWRMQEVTVDSITDVRSAVKKFMVFIAATKDLARASASPDKFNKKLTAMLQSMYEKRYQLNYALTDATYKLFRERHA